MSDGPRPCANKDCQHDAASHYTVRRYDYEKQEIVTETCGCLARGCECGCFVAPGAKTWR